MDVSVTVDRRPSTVDLWAVQSGLETFALGCYSALKIGEAESK